MIDKRKSVEIHMADIRLDPLIIASYGTCEQQRRIEQMIESLKEQGQHKPIIVNENLTIIWSGHTRYFAAKRLKWATIDAIIMNADEWDEYIMTNNAQVHEC